MSAQRMNLVLHRLAPELGARRVAPRRTATGASSRNLVALTAQRSASLCCTTPYIVSRPPPPAIGTANTYVVLPPFTFIRHTLI